MCLPPEDAIRLSRTCHRLRCVYYRYKHNLPRRSIQTISVQYGQWRDVLKGPYGHVSDKVPIQYVLSEPMSRRKRPSVKLFRTRRRMSLQDVFENSQFETMILSVQLIHGDLSVAVPFPSVRVKHLILNLGHRSLLPRRILRYLPRICDDLCANAAVGRVDFVFAAFDQSLKDCVENSRLTSLKKISVVFVNCLMS
ncbi:hypothetical protein AAVH_32573 [Aphelenchoides avenae]|nr:hypothetical protein AAVH_32573 [Aphelenchus avenae]